MAIACRTIVKLDWRPEKWAFQEVPARADRLSNSHTNMSEGARCSRLHVHALISYGLPYCEARHINSGHISASRRWPFVVVVLVIPYLGQMPVIGVNYIGSRTIHNYNFILVVVKLPQNASNT